MTSRIILNILFITFILANFSYAQSAKNIALLFKSKGNVELKKQNAVGFQKGRRGNRLNNGDILKTGKAGQAALVFTDDKTLMRVWENSNITIHGQKEEKTIAKRVEMASGLLFFNVRKQQRKALRLETPYGVATIKGTSGVAEINESLNALLITVWDGLVDLANQILSAQCAANQTCVSDGNNIDIQPAQAGNFPPGFGPPIQGFRIEFRSPTGAIKYLIIQPEGQE